jgi:hypothetical protein
MATRSATSASTRIATAGLLLALGLSGASSAQAPAGRPEAPTYSLGITGGMPVRARILMVLRMDEVQRELKLTEVQKQRYSALVEQQLVRVRKANVDHEDREIFRAARNAIDDDCEFAIRQTLQPGQRERLEQIQLQVQGPFAFEDRSTRRRLKLSADQADDIEAIATEGTNALAKASAFPIALGSGAKPQTQEAIKELVGGLEFQLAKEKARHLVLAGRADVMLRIVNVLTAPQRAAYRTMLGAPFDIEKISPRIDITERDVRSVARSLGLTGQRADTAFDVKIAHPAYTSVHPRVVIDEAHHNFHTFSGRYNPFASLIANDGYQVSPNRDKFTPEALRKCEVMVIANALAGESMGSPGADKPAFTDDECRAVRDWVNAGGALLLITDHSPFGVCSENLGKQFGVEMSKASVVDRANVAADTRGLLFSRDKQLVGDHPITRGRNVSERISRVKTFSGQGLKGPEGSTPLLNFATTATVRDAKKQLSAHGQTQGLALKFGRGRVVVLGEAAQLSAQLVGLERTPTNMMGMNAPGSDNRQFALNIMHWLSKLLEPGETKTNGSPPTLRADSATTVR